MSYSTILPTYGWAYSPFGGCGGVGASVTYPQSILDIQNDIKLMNFNSNVDKIVAMAAGLNAGTMNVSNNLYSNIAQSWQNMMSNLLKAANNMNIGNNSGITINPFVPRTPVNPVDPSSASTTVEDTELLELINKMLTDDNDMPNLKDNLDNKIDRDSTDPEAQTYGGLLLELVSNYINADIDGVNLTPSELVQIKTILGSYKANESLTSAQLGQLKTIIKNHFTAEQAAEAAEEAAKKQRSPKYKKGHDNKTENENIATGIHEAIDGWFTNKGKLSKNIQKINETNILEILDKYKEKHGLEHGETMIEAILYDCEHFDKNEGISYWGEANGAPCIERIVESLKQRVQDLKENNNLSEDEITNIEEMFATVDEAFNKLGDSFLNTKIAKEKITNLNNSIYQVVDFIRNKEKEIYGEDDC